MSFCINLLQVFCCFTTRSHFGSTWMVFENEKSKNIWRLVGLSSHKTSSSLDTQITIDHLNTITHQLVCTVLFLTLFLSLCAHSWITFRTQKAKKMSFVENATPVQACAPSVSTQQPIIRAPPQPLLFCSQGTKCKYSWLGICYSGILPPAIGSQEFQ